MTYDDALLKINKEQRVPPEQLDEIVLKCRKNAEILVGENEGIKKSLQKCVELRDLLIWISLLRLGRRTTEITTLSLQEVSNAEINNTENSYTINIKNHKTRKHDKNAYIAFNEPEFQILQTFIKDYRPELTSDTNPDSPVFPIKTNKSSKSSKLFLQNVHRILNKFKTEENVTLTSRITRKSIVSNAVKERSDLRSVANVLWHNVVTAERY